jgi:hypothetical protein
LANFELEQTGERLRLIDADDGSVYEGTVTAASGASMDSLATTTRFSASKTQKLSAQTPSGAAAAEASKADGKTTSSLRAEPARTTPAPAAAAAWSFRVSGTNRSLQQPVQLDGLLIAPSNSPPNRPEQTVRMKSSAARFYRATPSADRWATTNMSASPPAGVSAIQRIQGTLRIGTTNQTQLEAYRLGP